MSADPRSTVFPYTTLFRSCSGRGRRETRLGGQWAMGKNKIGVRPLDAGYLCAIDNGQDGTERVTSAVGGVDRKSTRLNSSHSQISYAVFCLKKKNTDGDHQ